jgi:hypothetical protein
MLGRASAIKQRTQSLTFKYAFGADGVVGMPQATPATGASGSFRSLANGKKMINHGRD